MAKNTVQFVCNECGQVSSTYSGRCFNCGAWNSLREEIKLIGNSPPRSGQQLASQKVSQAMAKDERRLKSAFGEIDDVFGGGLVNGSVTLLAGQPGIGKSTLLMQLASSVARQTAVLYVSGEESAHQIALRAKRLGVNQAKLELATSTVTDDIAATISAGHYQLIIVDSIQSLSCQAIASAAGSVSQITNSTQMLSIVAKQTGTTLIIVGHVTKEGSIAGPKLLEHLVDVVAELDGDRYGGFKVLRTTKNRFGSTSETAIFEMNEQGLEPVMNPSQALLAERQVSAGSIVLATLEGTRPILVEVQALVNKTNFGYPKRTASGLDSNRLNILIAMLERRTSLDLYDKDIYINIVGGLRLQETAADLAICMAIASAAKSMQLSVDAVVFGEVGLSGEIRHVPLIEKRLLEARKMGFKKVIGPKVSQNTKLAAKYTDIYDAARDIRSTLNNYLTKSPPK